MKPDLWQLYRSMLKSRFFEEAVVELWNQGKISGEMHLAIGEEGIAAGVVAHLQEGDALALDHRGTPQLLMRGIDPVRLLLELLGHPDGLCGGKGGHMHLFSKEHLLASSGIVGASCPAGVGFALAHQYLRPGKVAVAFFGEGAMNQGMVMESFNLSSVWKLPVIFICKDNRWAITTPSGSVTAGTLVERARSFGIPAMEIDGSDVATVWNTTKLAINRARRGKGPAFFHMHCFRPEGHFLGDPLIRIARHPVKGMKPLVGPLLKSAAKRKGTSLKGRSESLWKVVAAIGTTMKNQLGKRQDPLKRTRRKLASEKARLRKMEEEVRAEIQAAAYAALHIANKKSQDASL
jgi:TPP-dependent pyruvate/acetoin dehydrogenase alpha subunit